MKINGVEVTKDQLVPAEVTINGVHGTAGYIMPSAGFIKVILDNGDCLILSDREGDYRDG